MAEGYYRKGNNRKWEALKGNLTIRAKGILMGSVQNSFDTEPPGSSNQGACKAFQGCIEV